MTYDEGAQRLAMLQSLGELDHKIMDAIMTGGSFAWSERFPDENSLNGRGRLVRRRTFIVSIECEP